MTGILNPDLNAAAEALIEAFVKANYRIYLEHVDEIGAAETVPWEEFRAGLIAMLHRGEIHIVTGVSVDPNYIGNWFHPNYKPPENLKAYKAKNDA